LLSAAPAAGASRTFFGPFSASGTFNCSGTFFPPNSGTARVVFTGNITITLFDSASGVAQLSDASRTFSGCYQEFQNWNFGHDLTNTGGDHWVHTSNFPVDSYYFDLQVAPDGKSITGTFRDVQHWPDGSYGEEVGVLNLPLANPITVTNVFHYRLTQSENDVNVTPADVDNSRLFFGANAVPNGFANPPTTGVATQGTTTRNLNFDPLSVNLNLFDRSIAYAPGLTGSWTLTFTNGTETVRTTPSVGATPAMPFVKNMTISGSGITPTFSWTVPSTAQVDSVRIFIWDVGKPFPGGQAHADIIHIVACNPSLPTSNTNCNNFSSNATSYTLPSLLSSGQTLQQGNTYSVSINLNSLRNPGAADTNNNIQSQSRSFFDFTPLPADYQTVISCADTPSCPVYLPTHIHTGAYEFTIGDIVAGQTYFVDPPVAIGFDYATGPGDPNFKSVLLPEAGDNVVDLYLWNGSEYKYHVSVASGFNYTFPTGVDRFRVLGIEASAGLDPNNVTAFITGLTFVSSGQFTGTMTPIIASDVIKTEIKPGDGPNCINPKSKGLVPFAILGGEFDVTTIKQATLQVDDDINASTGGVAPAQLSISDINGDGINDLVIHFNTQDLNKAGFLTDGRTLYITARLLDGTLLVGSDVIFMSNGPTCQ